MELSSTKNLLVYNASAGSGKTFTLVREFLKLALKGENPLYFRKILAITFTRKAAAEMKERVIETLKTLSLNQNDKGFNAGLVKNYSQFLQLDQNILQSRASAVLKSMLHNYADLSISTIDRFTQKLIRSFSKDLNINNDFEVLLDHDELLQEAIDRLLSEVGQNKELTKTILAFLRTLINEDRSWKIDRELFRFSGTLFDENSIDYINELKELKEEDFTLIQEKVSQRYFSLRKKIELAATEACLLLEKNNLSLDDFSYKNSSGVSVFLKLRECKGDLKQLSSSNRFKDLSDPEKSWYPKTTSKEKASTIDTIIPAILPLQKIIADQLASPYFFLLAAVHDQLYSLSLLFKIDHKLNELKDERDILFIDDFNRIISEIVLNEPAPFIYEKAGEWYAHILIDEFQDTSVLQWQNFIPLIENALSNGTQCMLVGDGKQAIYRFRNGEVEQLAMLPLIFGASKNELLAEKEWLFSENFQSSRLPINFRSQQAIVLFNNLFFENFYQSFQHSLKKVYEENKQTILDTKSGGYVEWKNVEVENVVDKMPEQLDYTLSVIRQCLEDGFRLSDITCLVQKNSEGNALAQFLTGHNYPIVSSDSLLINSSLSVKLLFTGLMVLDDQDNNEINAKFIEFYLRLNNRLEESTKVLIELNQKNKINLFSFLKQELVQFYPDQFSKLPLYQQLEKLADLFNCDTKNTYVNAFFEEVFQFSLKGKSRSDFIDYWQKNGDRKSVKITLESNAIQIMTIHKSKGLQFPVVILPFADWDMNKKTKSKVWINVQALDLPLKHLTVSNSKEQLENLHLKDVYEDESSRTMLDHINLLYVAFTRPEERLYFCTSNCRGNRISSKIKEFAETLFEVQEDHTLKKSGTRNLYSFSEKSGSNTFKLDTHFSPDWQQKIRISYEASKTWADASVYDSARYGNRIHSLLAKIKSQSDLDLHLEEMLSSGEINVEEFQLLKSDMQKILSHQFIQELLDADQFLSEAEVVDEDGLVHRPDRIVFTENGLKLIDFKTGVPRESHKEQISRYGDLISRMGYKQVEKYLFYTQNCEVQEVN